MMESDMQTSRHGPDVRDQPAGQPAHGEREAEVTPAMIEAGLEVLYSCGIVDDRSAEDSLVVSEIFLAMNQYLREKEIRQCEDKSRKNTPATL